MRKFTLPEVHTTKTSQPISSEEYISKDSFEKNSLLSLYQSTLNMNSNAEDKQFT